MHDIVFMYLIQCLILLNDLNKGSVNQFLNFFSASFNEHCVFMLIKCVYYNHGCMITLL